MMIKSSLKFDLGACDLEGKKISNIFQKSKINLQAREWGLLASKFSCFSSLA